MVLHQILSEPQVAHFARASSQKRDCQKKKGRKVLAKDGQEKKGPKKRARETAQGKLTKGKPEKCQREIAFKQNQGYNKKSPQLFSLERNEQTHLARLAKTAALKGVWGVKKKTWGGQKKAEPKKNTDGDQEEEEDSSEVG